MKKLLFLLITFSYISHAQEFHHGVENENHDHEYNTEFGVALGAAYLNEEKEIKPSFHLHLVNSLKNVSWFKLGVGFETLIDKHVHINPTFVLNYKVHNRFSLGTSPGVLFLKEDGDWQKTISIHFEIIYHLDLKGLHLEPLIEYSYSKIDSHFLIGLHIGFVLH